MSRLDKERQAELEPKRIENAYKAILLLGYDVEVVDKAITFLYKGNIIRFWAYSGYFNGKGIKAGRGLENLIKQLK